MISDVVPSRLQATRQAKTMSIPKNGGRSSNQIRSTQSGEKKVVLLPLLVMCLTGCGPGADDPAAVSRIKSAGMLTMKQNDQVYQIKGLKQPITPELASDIASLGHLKNIDFGASELTDELFAAAVGNLDPISVVLSNTAITDSGLSAMAGYGRVEAIFLRDTHIGDAGLKAIAGLRSLTEIDLTGTRITGDGLAHLKGLTNLKRLIVDKTAVDDAGLEHLKNLTSLSKLEVRETAVTPEGVKSVSGAIPGLLVEQ